MGKIYAKGLEFFAHFTPDDVMAIEVYRIKGSKEFNYYAKVSALESTKFPITKQVYDNVLDMMKDGKICLITFSAVKDIKPNFE